MEVIELFSGIGSPAMALKKIGLNFKVTNISEINKKSIEMYNLIHGEVNNLGDIKKIEKLPKCNLLHASSPCTSFSDSGKKNGLAGESGLLLDVVRLLKQYKELPEFFTFENVKELKTKFTNVFDDFIKFLNDIGYNTYENILNAAYFNNPQRRERLFIVGIRKDIDKHTFIMPENTNKTELRLKDILLPEELVDEAYRLPQERFTNRHYRVRPIPSDTFKTIEDGYFFTENSKNRTQSNRIYNRLGLCPTLTTKWTTNILEKNYLRRLTPLEHWRVMGFDDNDFDKIKNFSNTTIVAAVGNSIALGPLEAMYRNLFKNNGGKDE